jgi:serine protease Do
MEEPARRHLIKPVVTQGTIGDVLPGKIDYDAQTISGGSGGPLFNDRGQIIGINFAMVRDFSGSNFAIPVRFGESPLKRITKRAFRTLLRRKRFIQNRKWSHSHV